MPNFNSEDLKGFSVFAPLVEAFLKSIQIDNKAIFEDVHYGAKDGYEGYPVAEFFKKETKGEIQDTHKNKRQWIFSLLLIHEFNGDAKRSDVEAEIDVIIDAVTTAFDQNDDLDGNVHKIEVVNNNNYDIMLEGAYLYTEYEIIIEDFVNRYE